ncbi:MAG: hypothetical protein RLY97_719 [Pseudomonadota bacterium]
MEICVIYDCLFPWTIGGAERWYRALAEALAAEGHQVTYLTLRQWDTDNAPDIAGVQVVAVGPRMNLWTGGRRRIAPPLRFGLGVLLHMLRHGHRYDHVHCASFPFFSLLALGLVRPFARFTLGVDWHEVWTRDYWRSYLGRMGIIGWLVQFLCAQVPQQGFAFSQLHARRLAGLGRVAIHLPGEYAGGAAARMDAKTPPTLLYVGRLIPEKRVDLLVAAFALALAEQPELRLEICGDGPMRDAIAAQVAELGLATQVDMMGFVDAAVLDRAMAEATVIIQPSMREGYGMVVIEAAVRGVPAIVLAGEDNAATELISAGENGLIAQADAASLAKAIIAVVDDGPAYRQRTAHWYAANAQALSLDNSLEMVKAAIMQPATIEAL